MFASFVLFVLELAISLQFAKLLVMPVSIISKPIGGILVIPVWVGLTTYYYALKLFT